MARQWGFVVPVRMARQGSSAAPTLFTYQNGLQFCSDGVIDRVCRTRHIGATKPVCRARSDGATRLICRTNVYNIPERAAFRPLWLDWTGLSRHPGWCDMAVTKFTELIYFSSLGSLLYGEFSCCNSEWRDNGILPLHNPYMFPLICRILLPSSCAKGRVNPLFFLQKENKIILHAAQLCSSSTIVFAAANFKIRSNIWTSFP